MNHHKIKVGISLGDPNGIGAELIIKTFTNQQMFRDCTPIIYGSAKTISFYKKVLGYNSFEFHKTNSADNAKTKQLNIIDCWSETAEIKMGQASREAGGYAIKALESILDSLPDNGMNNEEHFRVETIELI